MRKANTSSGREDGFQNPVGAAGKGGLSDAEKMLHTGGKQVKAGGGEPHEFSRTHKPHEHAISGGDKDFWGAQGDKSSTADLASGGGSMPSNDGAED